VTVTVFGWKQCVHTLIEHNLVDELRLTIYPVVLRAGCATSAEPATRKPVRLSNTRTVGDDPRLLIQKLVRDA